MSKPILISAIVLPLIFLAACQSRYDDARYQIDASDLDIAVTQGFMTPDAAEVDLVEKMALERSEYRKSVVSLLEYYKASGNAMKQRWAENELEAAKALGAYRYLMPAESAYAELRATDSIAEADELFEEALQVYKEAGGLLIITNENKLRIALSKFNQVISDYPSSDKIDDSAYRAGRIYDYFKDYQIAAVYYQRAFQWSDSTPYPARFRAGYVLDQHLHMRKEALALYELAAEKESRYETNMEYTHRRIRQLKRLPEDAEVEEIDASGLE